MLRVGVRLALEIGSRRPGELVRLLTAPVLIGSRALHAPARVRLRVFGRESDFIVPDRSGFLVLWEVFCEDEYLVDGARRPRAIVDLGANSGASALFFARRYPQAQIVAVEASRTMHGLLARNTAGLPVRCLHAAVSDSTTPVEFVETRSSWSGHTVDSGGAPGEDGERYSVDPVRLDDLLDEDVDLLKIDVEGSEFAVLPRSRKLGRVEMIVGELHAPHDDARTIGILELLRATHDVRITSPLTGDNITFLATRRATDPSV
ncbi:MAG: hypothetical protein QOH62_16 [Solirubrobacteraceae bacterium]|nr:hypothetical protein [Solirubrobacteraceae bacterium]